MYQISKRLTIAGAFLSLACGFLLTQQPTKAATTSQAATPTTQVVKADSNVLGQGIDGNCKWDLVKDGADGVKNLAADPNEMSRLGVRAGNSTAISSALELKLIRTSI